jgi:Protein of unknown function (DUF550)
MTGTITQYVQRQREWSERTFGPGLRTKGITAHIRKELAEIEAQPRDLEEWIDVITLAADGYWRAGGNPEDLLPMLFAKHEKNRARQWPAPVSEDAPVEQVRHDVRPVIGHCKRCRNGRVLDTFGYCRECNGEEA